jgi:protein SCO1
VTFLYTHCPTICPLIGSELQQALKELGPEAGRVAVVALSVDPVGDTESSVRAWLRVHQEPPNFHYLIGSRKQLRPYWHAWHVGPQIVGDPDSSHTAAIYLVTARGRIAGLVDAGKQVPSSSLAHDFRQLLAG